MDPVTTAIVAAVSAGLDTAAKEAIKDAYQGLKQAIKKRLGITGAINDLEIAPDSRQQQQRLVHEMAAQQAHKDPKIAALVRQLVDALQATEAGSTALAKYQVDPTGAQVGVIGDGARIEGGIHFHQHHHGADDSDGDTPRASKPAATRSGDDEEAVRLHILHLSDLHFGTKEDAQLWSEQLSDDLKQELDCDRLDVIIVSGDVANFAVADEYDAAFVFFEKLCNEFAVYSSNLVIVPGNHDLNWKRSKKGYILVDKEDLEEDVSQERYIKVSDEVIRLRDDEAYQRRFEAFARFYEKVTRAPYSLDFAEQGTVHHLKDLNLLVLGLNSAWQTDHHFTSRAGICTNAFTAALNTIRRSQDLDDCLKFAVWHHPLDSPFEDRITDHGFMERLAQRGFSVCLHGHLHKATNKLFRYDQSASGRKIEIVGAGTFGAPVKEWYDGYPLQYNLLKIYQSKIIVETRRRNEINGAWKPDAIWTQGKGLDPLPRFTIDLEHSPLKPPTQKKKTKSATVKEEPKVARDLQTEIDAYCKSAEALYENLPLMGFRTKLRVPIRIEDIYVPLRAMLDMRATGNACFADAEDAELKLDRDDACKDIALPQAFERSEAMDRRGIVILGDPGSGKTTHMKRLLLWCLRQGPDKLGITKDMIPVFLPLRELHDLDKGLDAFIQDQLDKPHLGTPAGFGKQLVARGDLLFLLDGLDEVADPDQRASIARWIDEALQVHSTCRFVVTCRFAGYTDQARLSEQFLEMHIRPLAFDQVETFVRNWYRIVETGLSRDTRQAKVISDERSQDLIERLKTPEFRARRVFELTRNPLLLTNICLVHRDRGNLPHSRDRLYEECTDVLLELWRTAIGYQNRVDARSGRKVLQPAALWMHQEEGRTRASADELAPVIEPALKAAEWPHGSAQEFLSVVQNESGLLTGWDQDHYGFMHLGFQEYLAALEIQNNCLLDPKVLNNLTSCFGQSWWQEVTLLLLSLNNPCLFVPFMRTLVRQPGFTQHPELVEMCLDDAAEKPVLPFVELVQEDSGKDPDHWQRQLVALKLVERLDNDALNGLIEQLVQHPYDKIRERVVQCTNRAEQDVICAPKGGYELVLIPGGEFLMGSPDSEKDRDTDEGPQHTVQVPDFYMGRYPVTNEEYEHFLADNPDAFEPEYWGNRRYNQPRQPVVGVRWGDARQYARWAGLQLPSEAQWEYACRAGTQTRFCSGDTEEDLGRVAWYGNNSNDKLHPLGEKEPNEFGLYDMHGNADEWVEDDWHDSYQSAPLDGNAWIDKPRGSSRVVRGGSWYDSARNCRSAFRGRGGPDDRLDSLGFRLVLLPQVSEPSKGAESKASAV